MTTAAASVPDVFAQWSSWLERATDRLFELDERAKADGTDADRADVAAAFVARKAVADRVEEIRLASLVPATKQSAGALASKPVVDDSGAAIGADLGEAARLLDAILGRVATNVSTVESEREAVAQVSIAIATDMAACDTLSVSLDSGAARLAALHDRVPAAGRDADVLAKIAIDVAAFRRELEADDARRTETFAVWTDVTDRLVALQTREDEVRTIVARAREKVMPLPNLAVPDVDALPKPDDVDRLRSIPWSAARAHMEPFLAALDRVGRALDEVADRYGRPLSRRDDLRGLVEAFRDKAGDHRQAEDPGLEAKYEAARRVLWSAPCDVDLAGPLVDEYTRAVNDLLRERSELR